MVTILGFTVILYLQKIIKEKPCELWQHCVPPVLKIKIHTFNMNVSDSVYNKVNPL